MKFLFLCYSLTVLFSGKAFAQHIDIFPCKIIMKDGSVRYGYIKINKSKFTPSQFEFYKENKDTGDNLLITPKNASLVEIADSLFYQSATIKIYDNLIDQNVLVKEPDEPTREGTFFLNRLIKGNTVSLYTLKDSIKTHFIIEDSTNGFKSLRYVRYYNNAEGVSSIEEKSYYRDQLLAYLDENSKSVRKKILNSRFTMKELIEAVMSINNSNQLTESAFSGAKERRIFYPFIEAGAGQMRINFSGINPNLTAMKFSPVIVTKFSAGVELHLDRKENLLTDIYTSIYPYHFLSSTARANSAGNTVVDTYELKATPVAVGVYINYAVLKVKKIKIALGAGYLLVINKISRNSLTTTDKNPNGSFVILIQPKMARTVGQYSFDMDVSLSKRISIRMAYLPTQDFSGINFNSFKDTLISGGIKFRL